MFLCIWIVGHNLKDMLQIFIRHLVKFSKLNLGYSEQWNISYG